MEFSTLPDTLRTSPAMSACPIPVLSAVTTPTDTPARPVTEGEREGLLRVLSAVPDPRSPRGLRYPLAGLLTVAVCAVMAGASSVTAISDWLYDLDDIARARLGFIRGVPATSTMWRLLIRLDADLLSTILAGWLRARTRPGVSRRPRYRQVIAVDGKTLRGARRPDGGRVHLLSALDTGTGIVLAQVTVAAKSNEIPAFTPLLDASQTSEDRPDRAFARPPDRHRSDRRAEHGKASHRGILPVRVQRAEGARQKLPGEDRLVEQKYGSGCHDYAERHVGPSNGTRGPQNPQSPWRTVRKTCVLTHQPNSSGRRHHDDLPLTWHTHPARVDTSRYTAGRQATPGVPPSVYRNPTATPGCCDSKSGMGNKQLPA